MTQVHTVRIAMFSKVKFCRSASIILPNRCSPYRVERTCDTYLLATGLDVAQGLTGTREEVLLRAWVKLLRVMPNLRDEGLRYHNLEQHGDQPQNHGSVPSDPSSPDIARI